MDDLIKRVMDEFRQAVRQPVYACRITIGDGGWSGAYTTGEPGATQRFIGNEVQLKSMAIYDLVKEVGRQKDARGLAAWGLDLEFDQTGRFTKDVHYPDLAFEDLATVPKRHGRHNPAYVYINLRPQIIRQFDDYALGEMVPRHVEQARAILGFDSDVAYTKSISEDFYLMMLNVRADGEIGSGGIGFLFEVFEGTPPELFVDIHRSYAMLGDAGWRALVEEILQRFSADHPNVDAARERLGLAPAAGAWDEGELTRRYHAMTPRLDALRGRYVKAHVERFTAIIVPA